MAAVWVEELLDGQNIEALLDVMDDNMNYDWSALLDRMGLPANTLQKFRTDGTINVDLFSNCDPSPLVSQWP